ncbi:MAG: hypothetical protein CMC55_00760 [Flavobacteriaceae bacterium]|nr:hypothetical protein [Flavobacteriaceae bacterium]
MDKIVLIICITLVIILLIYWIMPIEKMKAVNGALKSLLQVFPITQVAEIIERKSKSSMD